MTFTQSLASARAFAQTNVSYNAFTAEQTPISRGNSSSSLSSSSSGYETPPVGWVGVLYVLRHYRVQMAHFSLDVLRLLRNLLVPLPATMGPNADMANTDQDEPMPQREVVPPRDQAAIAQRHLNLQARAGRWAYSQETLAALRDNSPKGSGKSGKSNQSGKSSTSEVFADPWPDSSSASAEMPDLLPTNTEIVPAAHENPNTFILGFGPYWMNNIAYIQLSGEETDETDRSAYFSTVTHAIGFCPRTGHFCTGTCLNDVEKAMLLKHCVLVPNGALGGHFIDPQFRVVALPPWARRTFTHFWQYVTPFLRDTCLNTPRFAHGGEILRLNAIAVEHQAALNNYCETAKEEYSEQYPVEADAWDRLFIQSASRECRQDPFDPTVRTPVRPAQAFLAVDLHMVSNNVNARILDRAGSMYFVFYNGASHGHPVSTEHPFPPGLNCAYTDQTREVMQIVARETESLTTAGQSLLIDWLHRVNRAQGTPRFSVQI